MIARFIKHIAFWMILAFVTTIYGVTHGKIVDDSTAMFWLIMVLAAATVSAFCAIDRSKSREH